MSDVKIEVKDLPLVGKMIKEIALFTLKEFVKTTSVEEFKELKKYQLEEELLQGSVKSDDLTLPSRAKGSQGELK